MDSRLILERLASFDERTALVTPEERTAAARFAPKRRREYLAWRTIVRRETGAGVRIEYDAAGAPLLPGTPWHLGVSHCAGYVAVILSPHRCAVDVEMLDRDFSRVVSRCMTPEERQLSPSPLLPAAVWCAKETLYKYAREEGLDLLRDLRITEADPEAGRMCGRIRGGEAIALDVRRTDDAIVVSIG